MSVHVVTIHAHELRALLLIAAKKDVRYYLQGPCFETQRRCMVATDGHSLLTIKADFEPTAEPVARFVISRDDCERAAKLATKKNSGLVISLSDAPPVNGLRTFEIAGINGQVLAREVECRYPDWTRVVPQTSNGKAAKFDPDLVARMADAFALALNVNKSMPHIFLNGDSGALVVGKESHLLGVLMPWRDPTHADTLNDWRTNALLNFDIIKQDTDAQKAA